MINDRIHELIIYFAEGNKRRFSQLTSLSPSVIENLVGSRQGKPSFDVLEKIVCAFADINADWLITGRGEMLLGKSISESISLGISLPEKNGNLDGNPLEKSISSDEKKALLNTCSGVFERKQRECAEAIKKIDDKFSPIKQQDDDKNILQIDPLKISRYAVPFYDIPVSAGPLGVLTYSKDTIKPDGYIDMEIFRRCEAILPVIGVSMEPEIHSGDLIGIRKLERYSWEYVETGRVYMIVTQEDRMIKYINKADDPEYIICSSPNYHDFRIRKADVLEVYRVIANIRAL